MVKKEKRLIYIGPSLSKSRLAHATVFIGGFPVYISDIIDKHPWFEELFVPVGEYTEKLKILNKSGTDLNVYAKRCKEV